MEVGDLVRITTEFGKYFAYGVSASDQCGDISGMIGIYLRSSHYFDTGIVTAKVILSNGWVCDIFEPYARIKVISESG